MVAGCAIVREGANGEIHVIGFVYMTLPGSATGVKHVTTGLRTRVLGLSVLRAELGSGVSFGYSDNAFLVVGENTCMRMQPGEVLP
jgi:hypothetical protein